MNFDYRGDSTYPKKYKITVVLAVIMLWFAEPADLGAIRVSPRTLQTKENAKKGHYRCRFHGETKLYVPLEAYGRQHTNDRLSIVPPSVMLNFILLVFIQVFRKFGPLLWWAWGGPWFRLDNGIILLQQGRHHILVSELFKWIYVFLFFLMNLI